MVQKVREFFWIVWWNYIVQYRKGLYRSCELAPLLTTEARQSITVLHTAHCTLYTAHYNLHIVHYLSFKSWPMSSGVWCHQDRWGRGGRGGVNKCAATLPRRAWHNLPTSILQKLYCSPANYCVTPPVYGAVQCPSCIVLQPVCKQDTAGLAARASRRRRRSCKSRPNPRDYSPVMALLEKGNLLDF